MLTEAVILEEAKVETLAFNRGRDLRGNRGEILAMTLAENEASKRVRDPGKV